MPVKYPKILVTVIAPHFNLMNRYSAVASVIFSFSDLLRKNGHQVYVNEKSLEEWEKDKPAESIHSTVVKSKLHKLFPARLRELVKDVLLFRSNRSLLERIKTVPQPDLILCWVTYGSSHGIDLAKHWRVPVVSIFDNPLAEEYSYLKGFKPFFERHINTEEGRSLKEANAVIVYSHAVKEHLQKKHHLNKQFYFKAFTDFKRMNYPDISKDLSIINFAYIGSFFNWHKIEDLIEAFNALNEKHPNCRLYLIGDGPEHKNISTGISNPNIILTGKMDGTVLENQLKNIHVGIIPNTLWFHAPVKLFQYSANQLAVISKSTPTIVELVENKDFYLFFHSKAELLQHMIRLVENPQLIRAYGHEGQKYAVEKLSEQSYLDFFEKVFSGIEG